MAEIEGLQGNQIEGSFKEVNRIRIQFLGTGNTLIFETGVVLRGVRIVFSGHNATIRINANSTVRGVFICASNAEILIDSDTKFNKPCQLEASQGRKITLGKECLMANVNFYTKDGVSIYEKENNSLLNPSADIQIGNKVWIAENSIILKGSVIEDQVVVAAGSVVSASITANSIAAGNPATVVRQGITWDEQRL